MRIAFFEDRSVGGFGPLVALRPVFDLVCGRFTVWERFVGALRPRACGAFVRSQLAETVREAHPEAVVNDFAWLRGGPTLLLNGRWLPSPEAVRRIAPDEVGLIGEEVAYLTLDPLEAALLDELPWDEALQRIGATRRFVATTGELPRRPWELVDRNGAQLEDDHRHWSLSVAGTDDIPGEGRELPRGVEIVGPREDVTIAAGARLDPFVVIDARSGPVSVAAGAAVLPFTRLEGPCHVGPGSQVFRAHVRSGTTIGPECRVGGEVESSILHGYANKYHDGFLGHAYLCPWTNLGALTTNSDLKNDYGTVRVPFDDGTVDSGRTKVGCYVGDHAKSAIGSLMNTGTTIGVMCQLLPGGELLPKHVPSFARVWHGRIEESWELDRHLRTARAAMRRRGIDLTAAQERLLRAHHAETRAARERAVAADAARRSGVSEGARPRVTAAQPFGGAAAER